MNVRRLDEPHPLSDYGIVTVSVGVATTLALSNVEQSSLITLADAALYVAKQSGRNQVRESNVSAADFNRQPMRIGA